jgi:hypothetical protein
MAAKGSPRRRRRRPALVGRDRAPQHANAWCLADWVAVVTVVALYLAALAAWRDAVPPGLANDAAEEVLRGLSLLDTGTLTPITTVLGNSAETGALYLSALAFRLLGGGTFPVQLVGWIFAVLTIALFVALMRRLEPRLWPGLAAGIAAGSPWLFHYARSGLRASAAPVVTLAVALALDRLRVNERDRLAAAGAGVAVAAGLYAYTACRVLVIALLLAVAGWVLAGGRAARPERARAAGWIGLGALILSVPNIVYAIGEPAQFFGRGAYVLREASATPYNIFWSAMLPFHYTAAYNLVEGRRWFFDGVSLGLTRTGVDPISPWVGAAAALGVATLLRRWREPAVAFLLAVWLVGLATLGPSGPSLTRWLVVLPVMLVAAGIGIAAILRWVAARGWLSQPRASWAVAGLLVVTAGAQGATYVTQNRTSPNVALWFAAAATPIGKRAAELAREGRLVTCVVTKDASVVRLLTDGAREGTVEIVEFWGRHADAREVRHAGTARRALLIENVARFQPLIAVLRADRDLIDRGRFVELPPR